MSRKNILLIILFLVSQLLFSAGYMLPINGPRDTARGGAFIVKSDDLTSVIHNPANIINLDGYNTFISLGVINTSGTANYYDRNIQNDVTIYSKTISNSPDPFFNPMLAISNNFGLKKFNFSLAAHGPYAPDYKYDRTCSRGAPSCPNRYSLYESDIVLANLQLTIAYQILKNLSFGVGLKVTYINFKYDLDLINSNDGDLSLLTNSSKEGLTDANLKFDVTDPINFNAMFGLTYNINKYFSLALTYQTPISVSADGTMKTEIYDTSDTLTVNDTVIEGEDLNVKLNLPHTFGLGFLFEVKNKFNIELDLNVELWSSHDKIVITPKDVYAKYNALGTEKSIKLGAITQTKNWENTYNVSLGGDIIFLDNSFVLSLGAFYETGAISDEYFDVSIVDSDKLGVGIGFTYNWNFLSFTTSFAYIDFLTRDITNSKVLAPNSLQNNYPDDFIIGNGKFNTDILVFSTGITARF
jgi:long-subunit fatty acid transport protein